MACEEPMLSDLVRQLVFGWPFGCIVEFGDLGLCWSVLHRVIVCNRPIRGSSISPSSRGLLPMSKSSLLQTLFTDPL
ncbi:hypothetical protein FH972_019965 [Carpinus fangiana]|uniref:Uncharacterized protein n=1 Tax=Carpinus fangiana TaxID=176857 RepID=A0A5N6RUY8_9ROSI|nr:hypothetical protein FH972_019965 [Carpinus fangiana]